MPRKRRRTRRSSREVQDLVAEYKTSGETQAEFARRTGLSQSVLGRWIRRGGESSRGAFVRVDVKREDLADSSTTSGIEIVVSASPIVRVGPDFDEETLRRVLGVLKRC